MFGLSSGYQVQSTLSVLLYSIANPHIVRALSSRYRILLVPTDYERPAPSPSIKVAYVMHYLSGRSSSCCDVFQVFDPFPLETHA